MQKIFSSYDIAIISFYKSILEENGIPAIIKNYYLSSGVGDLPANACIPELWILDDKKIEEALALLKSDNKFSWVCTCGENIQGQFDQCWKCGKVRSI